MKKYNVWNKWGKLNDVMLGGMFRPGFFDDVEDINIRNPLNDILEETIEDLSAFEKALTDFGCNVYRPNVPDHIEPGASYRRFPRPPITPRDQQLIIGNKCFLTSPQDNWINEALREYNSEDIIDARSGPIGYDAAHMTLVGRDLYMDYAPVNDYEKYPKINAAREGVERNIRQVYPDLRVHQLHIGGHSDGAFAPIIEGNILTLHNIQTYKDTFPGWKTYKFSNVPSFKRDNEDDFYKKNLSKRFWVPTQEGNTALELYIETYLEDWIGQIDETVFDVNTIALDEKTICVVNQDHPVIRKFARDNKVELIQVPWRHRYFWDGGLHCLTLDLNRDGEMVDYFPERGDNTSVYDEGYDIPNEFLHKR